MPPFDSLPGFPKPAFDPFAYVACPQNRGGGGIEVKVVPSAAWNFRVQTFPTYQILMSGKKGRLFGVRDMPAARALAVSVVPALCSQRLLPRHPLSRATILAPHDSSFTTGGFLFMPPRSSRMMADSSVGSESSVSNLKISRPGRPKCFDE